MIQISGSMLDLGTIAEQYPPEGVERKIIHILSSSSSVYRYNSTGQLKFEINLRKSIINASIQLNRSRFSFEIFRKSRCNPRFWDRTEEGGFALKEGVMPSDGINDIYINGSKYATECATAIVIVFCKAVVDIYPRELSNEILSGLYLMNWQHLDPDLGIEYYRNPEDFLPGDCRYFKNPDVNPETPEWQGENAIDLGNGTFYGHGIGIRTADGIIEALNRHREEGSETSAYLLEAATRPDFKHLADQYPGFTQ